MSKQINSEIKFADDTFKVKVVTTDKKNPSTIYAELGTYIAPTFVSESYKTNVEAVEKAVKSFISGALKHSKLCGSESIVITEVASDRMKKDKKSYLEMQIYFKPTAETISQNGNDFKNIADVIYNAYVSKFIPFVKKYFENGGFVCTKTKN